MNLLAHDQVWGRDDWLTLAFLPPLMFVLVMLLLVPIEFFLDRDKMGEAIRFFVAFVGLSCLGAWAILWLITGIFWWGGWL